VDAEAVLSRRFPDPALSLGDAERDGLLGRLAGAGVLGGQVYDALIALEARAAGETLLTRDRRAQDTYRRLGVPFRAL
jgi:toxin FitB